MIGLNLPAASSSGGSRVFPAQGLNLVDQLRHTTHRIFLPFIFDRHVALVTALSEHPPDAIQIQGLLRLTIKVADMGVRRIGQTSPNLLIRVLAEVADVEVRSEERRV